MSDEDFRQLCNTYGFAPSRALLEMIDCVRAQEIEACAKVCEDLDLVYPGQGAIRSAAAIRARKDKQ